MVLISLNIEDEQYELVKEERKKNGFNVSKFMRCQLGEYFDELKELRGNGREEKIE